MWPQRTRPSSHKLRSLCIAAPNRDDLSSLSRTIKFCAKRFFIDFYSARIVECIKIDALARCGNSSSLASPFRIEMPISLCSVALLRSATGAKWHRLLAEQMNSFDLLHFHNQFIQMHFVEHYRYSPSTVRSIYFARTASIEWENRCQRSLNFPIENRNVLLAIIVTNTLTIFRST